MNNQKRVVALALTAIVLMGSVGGLFTRMAFAADPSEIVSKTISPAAFTNDTNSIDFTIEIKDVDVDRVKVAMPVKMDKSTVTLASDCDFEAPGGAILKVDHVFDTGVNLTAHYRMKLTGLKLKSSSSPENAKLKFTVNTPPDTTATPPFNGYKYEVTMEAKSTAGSSSNTSGSSSTPEVSKSNANYTVTKVSSGQRVEGIDKPGSVRFDIDNLTNSSDATIRQTYFADIIVRVVSEGAPSGLTPEAVKLATGDTTEMGSFVYDKRVSGIEMLSAEEGSYSIKFTGLRYTGNGKKLTFRVNQDGYVGDVLVDSMTECLTRQEQQSQNKPSDDDDDPVIEVETPYVIISKYGYGGGMVSAGQTFPLTMTFYNTSANEKVTNMMITMTMPEGLMLTSSSNTFYVDELPSRTSITKSVQVTARPDAKVQSHNVAISMKYQYVDPKANARRSAETNETIAIPLAQVDRFTLTSVELPIEILLEEENNLTVHYVNKGRSEVYNLTAEIEGDIQNPGQMQNLGNLQSGVTGSADFTIKPNQAGVLRGQIKMTYEDTNMEEKTATIEYFTEVKSIEEMGGGKGPGMMDPGMEPGMTDPIVPEEKSKMPIYIGIGAVVLLVVVVVVIKRVLKRRKEKEDADL